MSKKLSDIPETSEDIESDELNILNNILKMNTEDPEQYSSIKFVFFATAIFALLSLPFTDRLLELALPQASSWLILLGIKIVIFFVVYYIVFSTNKE